MDPNKKKYGTLSDLNKGIILNNFKYDFIL